MGSGLPYGLDMREYETSLAYANARHTQSIDLRTLIVLAGEVAQTELKYNVSFAKARDQRLKISVKHPGRRKAYHTALTEVHKCEMKAPADVSSDDISVPVAQPAQQPLPF